ncbi:Cullin-4B [Cichlidogyrus casuarinus]|uniref:Cullin-4B n=1 Tax=Cichlidogyrus casuarinus TaxID=1844966 RepID=A0ABD2Q1D4_9PLAT
MLLIRSIFLFLDRQVDAHSSLLSTWDLALVLFRQNITTETTTSKVVELLLVEVKKERKKDLVDRILLRSVTRMLIALKIYDSSFKQLFITQSRQLYSTEAIDLSNSLSVPEYLQHVKSRLAEEEDRIVSYLEPHSTRPDLISVLESELIARPAEHLIESGFKKMAQGPKPKYSDLALFYRLLQRIPASQGINRLRLHFKGYVKAQVKAVVDNPGADAAKDKVMIPSLLELYTSLHEIIAEAFQADVSFGKTMQDAFAESVNARANKPAEYLAKFLDSQLRSGNKSQNEQELDRLMERTMHLFRAIEGKDIFEAFYTKELAKRLLLSKSASIDAEKAMLSKLKQECGPNYTRKLEVMFKDNELSKELSKSFQSHLHQLKVDEGRESHVLVEGVRQTLPKIDLSVHVICPSSWPPYKPNKAHHPPEMECLRSLFTAFYLGFHAGRRLTYEPSLGTCLLKANHVKKELQVSEFQALVLLQFNGRMDEEQQVLTFAQLLESTGIDEMELKRALLSLSVGKDQKILLKRPMNVEVLAEHEFQLNKNFKHKLTRIKFNQIQLAETIEEQKETEERVFADRIPTVDCCIVRIMKTRKSIEHNQLMSEIIGHLKFPLKASDIKARIENLIERDYIKRDASNQALYHYMA